MENETIVKLYENFADEIYEMTTTKSEVCKKIVEEEDKLIATLSEEQICIFNKLKQYENERNELVNKNNFVYAFKLATRLFVEGMQD